LERHITSADLHDKLLRLKARKSPPDPDSFQEVLDRAFEALTDEPETYRPRDDAGLSGGIVILDPDRLTVVVPDVHARMDLILAILDHETKTDGGSATLLDLLDADLAQLVFLGDYVHSEARGAARWSKAFEEFAGGYKRRSNMDDEMRESLGAVEMLIEVKLALPGVVHLLKGNHENILNEHGRGNYPFRKFSQEGVMVADYMMQFYGEETTRSLAEVEHAFPLLAIGERFLVTHAEPKTFYNYDQIRNYRQNDDVVVGLTWTANDAAEPNAVRRMLDGYILQEFREGARLFGGHRPVKGRYHLRAESEYIQIHNPSAFIAAFIPAGTVVDPDVHIRNIGPEEEPVDAAIS
jgi:hypothetical protein